MDITRGLLVFFGAAILDFLWAGYVTATAKHRAVPAATYSAVIVWVNGALVLVWIHEPVMLGVFGLGAFAGTYLKLRWFAK